MGVKYSIVVPVFNEGDVVKIFYEAITPIMENLKESYEIIYVNDGSRDNTLECLTDLSSKDSRVKVISFARNFGQQPAIFAGFEHSSGEAVITMDVDLQDPVEVVPQMIEKWKEGYEIVHGKRSRRKGESFFKKFTSSLYLKVLQKISGLHIPQDVGEFKLLDRKVIDVINSMPEHDKYLRALTSWVGFKQAEVEFVRQERVAGKTKYSVKKLVKLAGNGIVSFSTYPLTISTKLGLGLGSLSIIAFLTFIVLACCKIFLPLTAWLFPTITLLFSISFVLNGFQNIYLRRTYDETRNRPRYTISQRINFDN